jgi:hypothetical protein
MRDTIDMAREAGFTDGELAFMGDNFRRFADLVRADERSVEREACAKLCDDRAFQFFSASPFFVEMHGLADAIRARSEK